jgi:hypothetical protein
MRRKLTITAVTTAVLMIAAVAFAAWTADGTGNGLATAGTSNEVGVSGSVASNLYPTGNFDLTVTITNTNPFNVQVTQVKQNGAVTVEEAAALGEDADCNEISVSFATQDVSGATWIVPANGNIVRTFTSKVSMSNDANDDCQGASFTIPLKAYAASTGATPSPLPTA